MVEGRRKRKQQQIDCDMQRHADRGGSTEVASSNGHCSSAGKGVCACLVDMQYRCVSVSVDQGGATVQGVCSLPMHIDVMASCSNANGVCVCVCVCVCGGVDLRNNKVAVH